MAIAPQHWAQARTDAPIHLQIRLDERPGPARPSSKATGPVVRIFRDDSGHLHLGDVISFAVNWSDSSAPSDSGGPVLVGRQNITVDLAWLNAARFLEVYLADGPQGYEVVWDQVTPLSAATKQPVNPPTGDGYGVLTPQDVIRSGVQPDSGWAGLLSGLRRWFVP